MAFIACNNSTAALLKSILILSASCCFQVFSALYAKKSVTEVVTAPISVPIIEPSAQLAACSVAIIAL
jgi:hypothetical protein